MSAIRSGGGKFANYACKLLSQTLWKPAQLISEKESIITYVDRQLSIYIFL